jgi:NAD(P)-dependent dehydrogenase (short-subunit alcohol dehydrogenase family)
MSNQLCVVVGVGPGLGLSIAKRFGKEGYAIALIARRPEALAEYANTLIQGGITVTPYSVDVADTEHLIQVFQQIQQQMGNPSVLVYNAAVMQEAEPLTLSEEALVHDFKVGVTGALTAIQQVAPVMQAQNNGTILLTGGALALDDYSFPSYLSLAIAKTATRKLCFTMANALEPSNIHVATVMVCGTITPNTHFDPDQIADIYWQLHTQPRSGWQREYVYK